jgi:formate hydrogenlyase subunit 6/NADH:ubiquinone oxidoreductase subunit I
VLFGVHPCDLAAIAYQDRFFAHDPYYQQRRARALLVGVNCLTACAGGFCHDVGAGPFADAGFDLVLTRLGDGRIAVEGGTARGDAALAAAGIHTSAFDADTRAARAAAESAAVRSFPARPFIARAIARIDAPPPTAVTDAEWQALGPSCFACTGCTNVCPTCSCFTVVDEAAGAGRGERARHWDSCLLEGFQREASGHHPAPSAGDRVRRFWHHKLSNGFATDFGRVGCVGCGRCDTTCLGSIGALSVLRALGSDR